MTFVIVKNGGVSWYHYFLQDPKEGFVHPTYSCHETFTGKELAIKPSYEDYDEAVKDCEKLNQANPSGDYAVCKLMQHGT